MIAVFISLPKLLVGLMLAVHYQGAGKLTVCGLALTSSQLVVKETGAAGNTQCLTATAYFATGTTSLRCTVDANKRDRYSFCY